MKTFPFLLLFFLPFSYGFSASLKIWQYETFNLKVSGDSLSGDLRGMFIGDDYVYVRFFQKGELMFNADFSGSVADIVSKLNKGPSGEPFYKRSVLTCILEVSGSGYFSIVVEEGYERLRIAPLKEVCNEIFVQSNVGLSVFDKTLIEVFKKDDIIFKYHEENQKDSEH